MRKSLRVLFCLSLLPLIISGPLGVRAQTAQTQLDQLVAKVKATPSDDALREQVIATAVAMKPPPGIPEEARRAFVQGSTIAKDAKDAGGQKLAADSFRDAIKLAPWWGDAYYNLAIEAELLGAFSDAKDALKWYIKTKPGEKEERAAQDEIYAIEAREKLSQTNTANEAARIAQKKADDDRRMIEEANNAREALMKALDGAKFSFQMADSGGTIVVREQIEVLGSRVANTGWSIGNNWAPWEYCNLDGPECRYTNPNGWLIIIKFTNDGRLATKSVVGKDGRTVESRDFTRQN